MGSPMKINLILVLLSILAISMNANATDAGSVLFATGPVMAERAPPVALVKGDIVVIGDTIATGEAARAQLLMLDGAKVALRPNSRFQIEEFNYSGPDAGDGQAVISSDDERSVSSLLKGGFRTITGAIGKEHEESYEVRTPVGVLGIRGTDYTAIFCSGDCNWVPGVNPADPIEDGLYLGVSDGTIVFRNENGDIVLSAGEFAFIPVSDRRLRELKSPPPMFLDENDLLRSDGTAPGQADDGSQKGFDDALGVRRAPASSSAPSPDGADGNEEESDRETPAQPVIAIGPDGRPVDLTPGDPGPQGNRSNSFSTGPILAPDTIYSASTENDPSQYQLDASGNLVGFASSAPGPTGPSAATYAIGTAGNVNTGFDSMTVMRWGRWSGGAADVTIAGAPTSSLDLANQSLHWVSGPDSGIPATMPITGTASYRLTGNTNPTDNLGNVGALGNATFVADFTRQFVTSTVSLDINNSNWMATGTGNIGAASPLGLAPHLFDGNYGSVVIDGVTGGTGVFSGFFSDPGDSSDPSFPGGVGMTYSLQDQSATTEVSGALVFGNP
jgi:hypothetical protein